VRDHRLGDYRVVEQTVTDGFSAGELESIDSATKTK